MATPEVHALLSASSADRWLHCTPAARLTEALPNTTSDYAEAGRLAHAIAELKLRKQYLDPMGPKKFANALDKLKTDPHFNPEMLSTTDDYMDFIHETFLAFPSRPYITSEQQVDFSSFVPEGFGTADCIMIGGNTLHIIDYKHGQGKPVDAVENPQMMLYALGAIERYRMTHTIDTVCMTIVQPRAGGVKSWELSRDALEQWGDTVVRPQAKKAFAGEGDQMPGEWCRFCKIRGNCRARGQLEAIQAFGKKAPPTYDDAEIATMLPVIRSFLQWADDVDAYALQAALAGHDLPGWKAVEGRSIRQFDDMIAAVQDIVNAGIDEALLYERKPLTLAGMEKVIGKKQFAEVAGIHIVTPPGKPTLVPITDKRPAIDAAKEAFKN